jgi:hypothetical protein
MLLEDNQKSLVAPLNHKPMKENILINTIPFKCKLGVHSSLIAPKPNVGNHLISFPTATNYN